ncbi:MAG: DoxX subfamily [Cyclobacteriaceae bacterium]
MENLSKGSMNGVVLMRILIGWHFLYEGVLKMYNSSWTSKGYLMSAELLSPFYQWLGSDSMIGIVDDLNKFTLMLVGLALILGIFERIGSVAGIALLILYYLAHPAFPGMAQTGAEGSYWIVNKNLIEASALYVVFLIPTGHYFGLSGIIKSSSTKPITE